MKAKAPSQIALAVLACGGVLLALGVAEIAARLLPTPDLFATRMAAFRDAVLEPDAALGWRAKPGATTTVGGVTYRFDALGCRGVEPLAGDARPRLLIAGDSMALGWGVPEAETFAGRLTALHPEWQVRNGGMVGFNLGQSVARVAELLPKWQPQRILLTYFPNDAEASAATGTDWLAWSALWRLVKPPLWSLAARAGVLPDVTTYHADLHAPGSPGWQRVVGGLTQFAALCRQARAQCTVALVPELQRQPYGLAAVHARVADLARGLALGVVDLAPALGDVPPRQLWVMPDDAHPNAEGHRRFAEALTSLFQTH